MISHRPRVIQKANWVVLLDDGQLKLEGLLEDLQKQEGAHLDFIVP